MPFTNIDDCTAGRPSISKVSLKLTTQAPLFVIQSLLVTKWGHILKSKQLDDLNIIVNKGNIGNAGMPSMKTLAVQVLDK